MKKDYIFTYQTKLEPSETAQALLRSQAELLCRVERCLFADYAKGKTFPLLKSEYLKKYGITARQFNALRVQLEGKIHSILALRQAHIERLKTLIEKVARKITFLKKDPLNLRRKKQQHERLTKKLESLIADEASGKVRLCFGSQKLFHAQFHLEKNGYSSHAEWKKAWHKSRHDSFFTLGSKDESAGNQTCQAVVESDGTLTLHLRLPNALITDQKYLVLKNVSFAYGHETLLAALANCKKREVLKTQKDLSYIHYGQAISYRFKQDDEGQWTVFASTSLAPCDPCTDKNLGTVGIDINADHLAMVEIDRYGNPIHKESFPLVTYGKTSDQAEALIGDVALKLVEHAQKVQKPLVLEQLDFTKKKESLKSSHNPSHARMLSSFMYGKIMSFIESRAYRKGVEVLSVDPAYTSVIGRIKYALKRGLSLHESAALCIARRGSGLSEKVPQSLDKIPDGKGGYVSLSLPARTRDQQKHGPWKHVSKKFKAELAAHFWEIKKDRSIRPFYQPV